MKLSKLEHTFVMHFGEMGSRWGINRTVGQIYALLFLASRPLNADEICEALGYSRSNISMGLKELDAWQLTRIKHFPEDRREYFTTLDDMGAIFRTVLEQRRKRQIEPTMTVLRDLLLENQSNENEQHAYDKILQMHNMIELISDWYQQIQKMDNPAIVAMLAQGPQGPRAGTSAESAEAVCPHMAKELAAKKCRRDEIIH